jgi:antirestriction protein ArdC
MGSYTIMPVLKYYNVFNVEQIEGIEYDFPESAKNDIPVLDACKDIVKGVTSKPNIEVGGSRAFYSLPLDKMQMPYMENFHTAEGFYSTLFHEMVQSTGHSLRLNRKEVVEANRFGSADYSREELVAELGACYLMCSADSRAEMNVDNSAAYIQSWLTVLKNDPKFILEASGKATKAVDYILGLT